MNHHLGSYPEYKDIDQPWVGAVPAHWRAERGKRLFIRMQRPALDGDQVVTCFRDGVVTLRRNRRLRGFTEALKEIGYQGIRAGDLVIHAMDAFAGAIGVSDSDGKGSPVYQVCQPREGVNAKYYAFLVREMSRSQWIMALAKGIRERSTDFRFETFGGQFLTVPPPAEQAGIVRFLGAVDRKVNRFIRAKRRLIEVLTEQKQAIITHAVTKGLNPSAPLKPSGIDWLGDVPEHWMVARAGSVAEFISTKAHEQFVEDDGEHICVTARFVSTDGRSFRRCTKNFSPAQRGDVLMVMSDLPRGRALARAYFVNDDKSYAVNQRVCILRPKRVNPRFLAFAANRHAELLAHDDGFNQTHLPNAAFKIMRLALPPLEEQEQIVESLVRTTSAIDATLERTEREIDLIREYRTRLVADVVTGKVDVRGVAIPDDPHTADAGDHAGADAQGFDGPGGDGDQGDPDDADAALAAGSEEAEA